MLYFYESWDHTPCRQPERACLKVMTSVVNMTSRHTVTRRWRRRGGPHPASDHQSAGRSRWHRGARRWSCWAASRHCSPTSSRTAPSVVWTPTWSSVRRRRLPDRTSLCFAVSIAAAVLLSHCSSTLSDSLVNISLPTCSTILVESYRRLQVLSWRLVLQVRPSGRTRRSPYHVKVFQF